MRLRRDRACPACACLIALSLLLRAPVAAQDQDQYTTKQQLSRIRELSKRKADAVPALSDYLDSRDRTVRLEAVRALTRVGGEASLAPLVKATKDKDSDVQIRAVDGLVNFYLPGYVAQGMTAPLTRGVKRAKSVVITRNDQVIDSGTVVRPDVLEAVANVVKSGVSPDSKTAAARAAGILRDREAVPALGGSLRANENALIFESLIALQKIKTKTELPSLASAAHDLDERTQIVALETIGLLHSVSSAPDVRNALKHARDIRVQRAALEALAMLGQTEDRPVFQQYTPSTDPLLRAASLEGLGRIREPEDYPVLERAYNEQDADWRVHLAAAFALVNQGKIGTEDFNPLPYLVENIATKSRSNVASAYLAELARKEDVRKAMTPLIAHSSRDGKLALCAVLGDSGSEDVTPVLQNMTRDADPDVATAAAKALRTLKLNRES